MNKKHIVVLLITVAICILIRNLLEVDELMTKLDVTYLYMLTYLCVKSLFEESGN